MRGGCTNTLSDSMSISDATSSPTRVSVETPCSVSFVGCALADYNRPVAVSEGKYDGRHRLVVRRSREHLGGLTRER